MPAMSRSLTLRRLALTLVALLAMTWGRARAAEAAPAAAAEGEKRPNIVFVISDDQRFDYLGCAGHPALKTPNIDRLAHEGAIFRNFFVGTPLCSPSRASYLTGLYPHGHRIINNDKVGLDFISQTLVTWPRMLRESGYETAFIGKWHMGGVDSRRPGFDTWISFPGQGVYIDGVANVNGVEQQLDGNMTDFLNAQALKFIEQKHDKPFALYLAHKAVHRPYQPTKKNENLYSDFKYVTPQFPASDLEGKPALKRKVEKIDLLRIEDSVPEPAEPRRGRGESPDAITRDQFCCINDIDDGVGQILQALQAKGQLDNTVVLYTSDNGYLMGEHGLFDNKRWAYEASIRVPFVIRYPKLIKPGTELKQMILNIDVAPSMLDIAGVQSLVKMHGESFVPYLKDPSAKGRDSFLAEYFVEKNGPRVPDWQAVRTGRYKFIHYPTLTDMDELYDLQSDPNEWKNLINETGYTSLLADMKDELAKKLKASAARNDE